MDHGSVSILPDPAIVSAYPPVWPVTTKSVTPIRGTRNMGFGGNGKIVGTVKEKGTPENTPVWRRVRLYDERSGLLVAETWSDPVTGAYAFNNIKRDAVYFVLAFDHTGDYRGVVADNLTPEAMP